MPTPARPSSRRRRAAKPARRPAAKSTRRRAAKPAARSVAKPIPSLEETLSFFEAGEYLRPTQNRPSIAVPNEHKPGPLPGVELPRVPGRPRGVTEIEAVITVDQYRGIQHGRDGDHEIVEGRI